MRRPWRSRLRQYSLRALFFIVTGSAVACAVWIAPFQADVKDPEEGRLFCGVGMSNEQLRESQRKRDALRETGTVYRDFHGNRIKHGLAVLHDGNGVKLRERRWSHGKLDGLATTWNSDGKMTWQGTFREGKLDGIATTWDENGEVERQDRYRRGKRHGWSKTGSQMWYYENDVLILEEMSIPHGKLVQEYHSDGSQTWTDWAENAEKLSELCYDKGFLRQGPTKTYHSNGMICCEGTWLNNHEHGTWNWWDDRGILVRTVEFEDGAPQLRQQLSCRHRYVIESELGTGIDKELSFILFGHSHLGTWRQSLGQAFDWLEELHKMSKATPPADPFRIQVRGAHVRELLDNTKVSQEADDATLRDALQLSLAPLHLEAVVQGNSVWIVDGDEARDWAEAVPISRFVSHDSHWISSNNGLKMGRTTLQGLFDELKTQGIALRLDEEQFPDPAALLAREVDAEVPGCTVGAALDIALSEIGLISYCGPNNQFVIVPLVTP